MDGALLTVAIAATGALIGACMQAAATWRSARLSSRTTAMIAAETDKTAMIKALYDQVQGLQTRLQFLEDQNTKAEEALIEQERINLAAERKLWEAEDALRSLQRKMDELTKTFMIQRGDQEELIVHLREQLEQVTSAKARLQAEYDMLSQQYSEVVKKLEAISAPS